MVARTPTSGRTGATETHPRRSWRRARAVGQSNPFLQWSQPLGRCLADYSHAYVRVAVSAGVHSTLRKARLSFQLNGQPAWYAVTLPLLADGGMREYGYDLKLLELPRDARLTGLRIAPVQPSPLLTGDARIQIEDVRLIRNDQPAGCTR